MKKIRLLSLETLNARDPKAMGRVLQNLLQEKPHWKIRAERIKRAKYRCMSAIRDWHYDRLSTEELAIKFCEACGKNVLQPEEFMQAFLAITPPFSVWGPFLQEVLTFADSPDNKVMLFATMSIRETRLFNETLQQNHIPCVVNEDRKLLIGNIECHIAKNKFDLDELLIKEAKRFHKEYDRQFSSPLRACGQFQQHEMIDRAILVKNTTIEKDLEADRLFFSAIFNDDISIIRWIDEGEPAVSLTMALEMPGVPVTPEYKEEVFRRVFNYTDDAEQESKTSMAFK